MLHHIQIKMFALAAAYDELNYCLSLENIPVKYLLISFDSSPSVSDTKLTALGPEQTKVTAQRQVVTCILCQEEQEVKVDNRAMVLAAFVQRSTVLSKNRSKVIPDPGK